MGRFLLPFTNFTRSFEKSLSFKRDERNVGRRRKKREERGSPPNRGILDQRLTPEGNHIFREETTASPFFQLSSLGRVVPTSSSSSCFPAGSSRFAVSFRFLSLLVRAGNLHERTDVFFRRFSCDASSRRWQRLSSGSHSGLIMHETPVSTRRLSSRTNPYGDGGFRTEVAAVCVRGRFPVAVEKNACGGSERTETIIYIVRGTKGSLEGRTKNGVEWILESGVIDRYPG